MNSNKDNWIHKSKGMICETCMWFVSKAKEDAVIEVGRCRRYAPTIGYPVVYRTDWCGDHRIDSSKIGLQPYKSVTLRPAPMTVGDGSDMSGGIA